MEYLSFIHFLKMYDHWLQWGWYTKVGYFWYLYFRTRTVLQRVLGGTGVMLFYSVLPDKQLVIYPNRKSLLCSPCLSSKVRHFHDQHSVQFGTFWNISWITISFCMGHLINWTFHIIDKIRDQTESKLYLLEMSRLLVIHLWIINYLISVLHTKCPISECHFPFSKMSSFPKFTLNYQEVGREIVDSAKNLVLRLSRENQEKQGWEQAIKEIR